MNTRDRAAIVAQYIVNHRDVEKAIHVGGNIKWIVDAIAEALQEERERCAKIAEQSAYVAGVDLSSGYTMACGVIADKIRAEGGA
jgi:hypothetical protein